MMRDRRDLLWGKGVGKVGVMAKGEEVVVVVEMEGTEGMEKVVVWTWGVVEVAEEEMWEEMEEGMEEEEEKEEEIQDPLARTPAPDQAQILNIHPHPRCRPLHHPPTLRLLRPNHRHLNHHHHNHRNNHRNNQALPQHQTTTSPSPAPTPTKPVSSPASPGLFSAFLPRLGRSASPVLVRRDKHSKD